MSDYASAISAMVQDAIETSRFIGRLMAQAGIPLTDAEIPPDCDPRFVKQGYEEQLKDYPNG